MEFFDGLYQNLLRFFSWEEFSFLVTGSGLLIMVNLVLSEGLLSFDNALVLAILVSHLSKEQKYRIGPFEMSIQQWALTAGLFGAYFFRAIAIILGTYLIQFWFLQLLGGGYLLWLAYEHFFGQEHADGEVSAYAKGFWATVLKVEMMDIAFSIDSILAALGISKKVWVILAGGMLGILCMRFVAGIFVGLIDRFPLFKHTGYALIFLIGYRLTAEVKWDHFQYFIDYIGIAGIFVIILFAALLWSAGLIHPRRYGAMRGHIQLAALIMFFSWTGTRLHLHMSDLVFSLLMLTVFGATFVFNDAYKNWRRRRQGVKAVRPFRIQSHEKPEKKKNQNA